MPAARTIDTAWGEYRLERSIGVGPRGQVFAASDLLTGEAVAIKVLLNTPSDDPVGQRFLAGPQRAAELRDRHIIGVRCASDVDGSAFVAMPRCATSMAGELEAGPVRVGRVHSAMAAACRAVDAAGAAGLVHTNLKPSNLLVRGDGRVVVSDYGSTWWSDDCHSTTEVTDEHLRRLPYFAAPEVLRGEQVTEATDVYSLGAVLYALLTAKVPFGGRAPAEVTAAHLTEAPPSVGEVQPEYADAFDPVVARAMAKAPSDRYASGAELLAGVESAIESVVSARHAARTSGPGRGIEPTPESTPVADGERSPETTRRRVTARLKEPTVTVDQPSRYRGARAARRAKSTD